MANGDGSPQATDEPNKTEEPKAVNEETKAADNEAKAQEEKPKKNDEKAQDGKDVAEDMTNLEQQEEEEEEPKPKTKKKRDSGYTKFLQEAVTNLKIADNKRQRRVKTIFSPAGRALVSHLQSRVERSLRVIVVVFVIIVLADRFFPFYCSVDGCVAFMLMSSLVYFCTLVDF